MGEDQAGERDGEGGGDDDRSDGPPGCAAQRAGKGGGEPGQEAGSRCKGGVHRVDALPARDGWAASCLNEPCGDGWDGERRHGCAVVWGMPRTGAAGRADAVLRQACQPLERPVCWSGGAIQGFCVAGFAGKVFFGFLDRVGYTK